MTRRHRLGGINVLVQVAVLVAAVALIGLLAVRQVRRVMSNERPVVVAQTALSAGTELTEEDLGVVKAPKDQVPPGVLASIDQAAGRTLQVGKAAGNAITEDDFQVRTRAQTQELARMIPEGRVVTTLLMSNATIPNKALRRGDRVDILVAYGRTPRQAKLVVEDAYVMGFLTSAQPPQQQQGRTIMGVDVSPPPTGQQQLSSQRGLVLALYPEDVLPLAEIDGSGAHISVALHSRESVEAGDMLSVARPRVTSTTVDFIVGGNRERVTVQ